MLNPQKPINEHERLEALHALNLLDTPQEERYDRLTRKLAQTLDVPIAYLAFIDDDRQWIKSVVGPMACEMERETAFCSYTILQSQPLIIPDTKLDPRFADHPLVIGEPYLRFYAGIPLRSAKGHNLGTLCVADQKPRTLNFDDLETLRAFAALVEQKINATPTVFISYSHQDEAWKDRLVSHLSVLQNENLLELWEDRQIEAGEAWHNEIKNAIESSNIAILLISAHFLTSQFILNEEVPRLLERRDKEGLMIIPLVATPCSWNRVKWLAEMNMYPKDGHPLSGEDDHKIDIALAELASMICEKTEGARRPRMPAPQQQSAPFVPAPDPNNLPQALPPETEPPSPQPSPNRFLSLRVDKTDEPAWHPRSYVFDAEHITIGRDPTNDLPLPDSKRLVSKLHAEIARKDDRVYLTDRSSRNFTYLNDEQLAPEQPYEIQPGDTIQIGKFEILIEALKAASPPPSDLDLTVFGSDFTNPFLVDIGHLMKTLMNIGEHYDREAPSRRDVALQEALQEALENQKSHPANTLIARMLRLPDAQS